MTGRLEGRVAIVTGGNSGIGEATVHAFAREGAKVALLARREAEGRRVEGAVNDAGGVAAFFACDVMERESIEAAVAAVIERFGDVSILVNNAGGAPPVQGEFALTARGTPRAHDAAWEATLRLNLTGTYIMTQVCWRSMVAAGGGSIINISSLAAVAGSGMGRDREGPPPMPPPAYFAAKAGVEAYTRWTASIGSKVNIRANAIRPGLIDTPVHVPGPDGKPPVDVFEPLQITPGWGTSDDTANLITFLASEESRFINAQVINLDGGMVMKVS